MVGSDSGSAIAAAPALGSESGGGDATVVVVVVDRGLDGIAGFFVVVVVGLGIGFVVVVVHFVVEVVGFVVEVVGFVVGGDETVVDGRHHEGAFEELQPCSD